MNLSIALHKVKKKEFNEIICVAICCCSLLVEQMPSSFFDIVACACALTSPAVIVHCAL